MSQPTRQCRDCPADISHRHFNAERCEPCAVIRNRTRNNLLQRTRDLRKTQRYRNDPVYREKRKGAILARRRERYATDPAYRKRVLARNRVDQRKRPYVVKASVRSRRRRAALGGNKTRRCLPALIEAQGGLCGICGEALPSDLSTIEVDHIIPVSKNGGNEIENLQAAHMACNRRKGARC